LALDIVESPVPAKRATVFERIDGLPSAEPSINSLAELMEFVGPEAEGLFQVDCDISPMDFEELLKQPFNDEQSLDNGSPSSPAPAATDNIPAELLTDAGGFVVSNVASYMKTNDFDNLMHSSKALRKSSLFYSKKAFSIPFDATEADVRLMLPYIQRVETVTIGFNLNHLTILQRECPKLRHLVVEHFRSQPTTYFAALNDASVSSFMNMLSNFGNLTTLKIHKYSDSGDFVVDIAPLATLTQLTELSLCLPGLVNITALSEMTKLTKLSLQKMSVIDLTPLISLKGLSELSLFQCGEIVIISPLETLTELTHLYLSFCSRVVNIAPLSGLINLRVLGLGRTRVRDIAPLKHLNLLTVLNLSDVYPLSDIEPSRLEEFERTFSDNR
jgi:hypothetical protein